MMIDNIVMLLAGVFSLVAIINILVPDYYNYVYRMSKDIPEKLTTDILFRVIMFVEVFYILLGFSSSIPLFFVGLIFYELLFALFIDISKYLTFMVYEFIFLVINLGIFVCLFLDYLG